MLRPTDIISACLGHPGIGRMRALWKITATQTIGSSFPQVSELRQLEWAHGCEVLGLQHDKGTNTGCSQGGIKRGTEQVSPLGGAC